jgi:CRP/FNR family cyclic AMP-dependent transcriptional regulator
LARRRVTVAALIDILTESKVFKGLKEDELRQVAQCAALRTFAKGDIVIEERSAGSEFFLVVSGTVAVNKNVAGGRKRNLSNLGPGELFGELSLFDSQPHNADAQAMEETEVVAFDNRNFLELLKRNLFLALFFQTRVIRILCKRLRDTDEILREGVIWGFRMDF